MYELIKSEKLFDWNANETLIDSAEINMEPVETKIEFVETKIDAVEECPNSTGTTPAKRRMNKPSTKKQTLPIRLKVCSTVPVNHFGPIPGIPVGTCWEKRIQVSEAGVHRPPVAGIHGREHEGAYSIVFSGSYADDEDFGEEFFYSGCGGAVSDPRKIITGQVCDQTLTNHNKALAVSCHAAVNDQTGAIAEDWKAGKPIRVVRTYKLRKHSNFAPDEGNRYDGIYKVVRYFPTMGQYGLLVWRFHLRRDDPEPAPWTEEGKLAIAEKNLRMIKAKKTDYIRKVGKCAKSKSAKRLPQKLTVENIVHPFPDQGTLEKIIMGSLMVNDAHDDETKPSLDSCLTKSKSPKSSAQQSPKKKLTSKLKAKRSQAQSKSPKSSTQQSPKKKSMTKSKRSCTGTTTVNQKVQLKAKSAAPKQPSRKRRFQFFDETTSEKVIGLEIGLPSANADDPYPNGLMESPRKRARVHKFSSFWNTDLFEDTGYQTFDTENDQTMLATAPTDPLAFSPSELDKTDEEDVMEIVPDISFLQANTSPEPAAMYNCNSKSNRSRVAFRQAEESVSKMKIRVTSVESIKRKHVAANSKTLANRKRNTGKNKTADLAQPLHVQCQIDLTTEEDDGPYVLPANVEKFIDIDTPNKNIWEYCKKNFLKSEADFKDVVSLMFTCRYCNQLAVNPVTTPCDHNACLECISNHFLKKIFSCPDCRNNLGLSFKIRENRNLANALENLFPGYNMRY